MVPMIEIVEQCVRFEERTGIEVSDHARVLIADIVNAIPLDPHPRWDIQKDQLNGAARQGAQKIGALLSVVAESNLVDGRITSFDLLHSISREIEVMCFITKI